ncbi:hypothetical protein HDU79_007821 [Rhizoclosmatium sp. JEL0117]|nr:hypothetical protein HDU79_007821 [Rhizoclosmatium sp. JEL0117]
MSNISATFELVTSSIGSKISTASSSAETDVTSLRLRRLDELKAAYDALMETMRGVDEDCDAAIRGKSNKHLIPPPPHFGDIMSMRETSVSLPDDYSPLERILLTANGNVQRILSAFYNSPVTVKIIKNERTVPEKNAVGTTSSSGTILAEFDRHVELICANQVLCTATSTVTLWNPEYLRLVVEEKIGIGQLFRYLNILPNFELLQVGRDGDSFWRVYTLSSGNDVKCVLKEVFPADVFERPSSAGSPQR